MVKIREKLREIPLLYPVYRALKRFLFQRENPERVFTAIYKDNAWRGKDSVSGTGSDFVETRVISEELPKLIEEYEISSMLDIPCGDFFWMKDVNLGGVDYLGADIVSDLIKTNSEKYGKQGVAFHKLNLISDELPKADLILCRDCLAHFSNEDVFNALQNICRGRAKYFLTTTFTERRENSDITVGQWRPLNLETAPFMLPRPLKLINEGCMEDEGAYADKSLGFWRVDQLRSALKRRER